MVGLECCVDSLESARAAIVGGGCTRLEICANLAEGGTTPSLGLVTLLRKKYPQVFLACLIRPRAGDFYYDEEELQCMMLDVEFFKQQGVNGVVLGVLDRNGGLNLPAMRELISCARLMEVSLNRAIDVCGDVLLTVQQCSVLGVDRILSSGGKPTALEGAQMLKKMMELVEGSIVICAAAGVSEENCLEIVRESGVSQLHGSLRVRSSTGAHGRLPGLSEERFVTCAARVRAVLLILDQLY